MLEVIDPPHHWHAAKFILSIKERHTLSQSAINCVISSTTSLMSSQNSRILSEIKREYELNPENVMELMENKAQIQSFQGYQLHISKESTLRRSSIR